MRWAAGIWLAMAVVAAGGLRAQSSDAAGRIFSAAGRALVSADALAADLSGADVVVLIDQVNEPGSQRAELALLQSLVGRRPDVVLAADFVDRAAQDALEHFQMEHLSDREFAAEARIPNDLAAVYLPLLKFAVARNWRIVATGPARPGAETDMSGAIVQAVTIGSAGGKRPLVISLHTVPAGDLGERVAARVRPQLPGRRVLVMRLVAGQPPSVPTTPPDVDYVVYTARP